MQRILVLGCSGAGKSTFSHRLAQLTGLPVINLDHAFWRPGWVETPREEWWAKTAEFSSADAWIMDGNYSSSLHIRLPRADTAILLDYPRLLCMKRVLGRVASDYGRVREGMPEGCPERLDLKFLRYVWDFKANYRPRLEAALDQYGQHLMLYQLRSDREADAFLERLR
jgi:adenylate kinase family enzyme